MPSKSRSRFLPLIDQKQGKKSGGTSISSQSSSIPLISAEPGLTDSSALAKSDKVPFRCSVAPTTRRPAERSNALGPKEQRLLRQILSHEPGWIARGTSEVLVDNPIDMSEQSGVDIPKVSPSNHSADPAPVNIDIPSVICLQKDATIKPVHLLPQQQDMHLQYYISPPLPTGLSLDKSSGLISGTPAIATCETVSSLPEIDTWTFTVREAATNALVQTAKTRFVVLEPPGELQYEVSFAIYLVGRPISPNAPQNIIGSKLTFDIHPPLPPGLEIDPTSGCISGTALEPLSPTMFEVTASNVLGAASAMIALEVHTAVPPFSYSVAHITCLVGSSIPQEIVPDCRVDSFKCRFEVAPRLPAGLELDRRTGAIRGVPAQPTGALVKYQFRGHAHLVHGNRVPYTVRCSNAVSDARAHLSLSVIEPPRLTATRTSMTFLLGKCAVPVMFTDGGSTAGTGLGLRFRVTPRLPRGLFLNASTGTLSGIPQEICMDGTVFNISAADSHGRAVKSTRISIMIGVLDHPHSFEYRLPQAVYIVGRRQLFADMDTFLYQMRRHWVRFHARKAVVLQQKFRRHVLRIYLRRRLHAWLDIARAAEAAAAVLHARWRRMVRRGNLLHRMRTARRPSTAEGADVAERRRSLAVEVVTAGVAMTQARSRPNEVLALLTLAGAAAAECPAAAGGGRFAVVPNLHSELLRRPLSAAAAEARPAEEVMNHMGRAGRHGCGKGNWISSLQGGGPWTFAVDPPLPPGLSLDPRNGCIVGAPTAERAEGVYTVSAGNKIGSVSTSLRIQVVAPPVPPMFPEYVCGGTLAVAINRPVRCPVENRAGTPPFKYTCLPKLPLGLRIDEATGEITGVCGIPEAAEITIFCENVAGISSGTLRVVVEREPELLRYWNCQRYLNDADELDRPEVPSLIFARGVRIDECRMQAWKAQPLVWEKVRRKGLPEADLRLYRWYLMSRPLRHFICRYFPLTGTDSHFWAEPELPRGLVLDQRYGSLSGAAEDIISPPQTFRICARNQVGQAFCEIKVEVLSGPSAANYDVGPGGVVYYLDGEEVLVPAPKLIGSGPFSFSVYPELPGHLRLNSDGSIAGKVPAAAPVFFTHFSVKVKNLVGKSYGKFTLAPETCVIGCIMDTSRATALAKRLNMILTRCQKQVLRPKSATDGSMKFFHSDSESPTPRSHRFERQDTLTEFPSRLSRTDSECSTPRAPLFSTKLFRTDSESSSRRAQQHERQEVFNFLSKHEVELRHHAEAFSDTGYFVLKTDPGLQQMVIATQEDSMEGGTHIFVDFSPYHLVQDVPSIPIVPDVTDSDLTDVSEATTTMPVGGASQAEVSPPIAEGDVTLLQERLFLQPGKTYPICILYSPPLKTGSLRVILTWNVAAFQNVEMKMRVWTSWGDQCTIGSPRCMDPDRACHVELMESNSLPQRFPIVCQIRGANQGDFSFSISVSQAIATQTRQSREDQKALAKRVDSKRLFLKEVANSAAQYNVKYHAKPSIDTARLATKVYVLTSSGQKFCFLPGKDGFIRGGIWSCCTINGKDEMCVPSKDSGKAVTAVETMIEQENLVKAVKLWNQLKDDGGSEEELVRLKNAINSCRKKMVMRGDLAIEASKAALTKFDFRAAKDSWSAARQHYINAGVCAESLAFGRSKAQRYDTSGIEQGIGAKYMEILTQVNLSILRLQSMNFIKQQLMQRQVVVVFEMWLDNVTQAKRMKLFSTNVLKKWLSGALQPAFETMKWFAREQVRVRQCLAKMKNMLMGRTVAQWRMIYEENAELRESERNRLEQAYIKGLHKLAVAEEIKKGKVYVAGEAYDAAFEVELSASWFMTSVEDPKDQKLVWGFKLPYKRALSGETESEMLPGHFDFEIFETAASKICETHKLQGKYAANIAQHLFTAATDWLQNRNKFDIRLNVRAVKAAVLDGMRLLKEAQTVEVDDPHVMELVKGLTSHVIEAERGFRRQLFEALEMQRQLCQRADRALQEADRCLNNKDFQGGRRWMEDSRKEIEKAAAWEMRPSVRSCLTRSHAAYVISRCFRASEKMNKPTYQSILSAMESLCAVEIVQANHQAQNFKEEAANCLADCRPEQGFDLIRRARELWNDRRLFIAEDSEIRASLAHLDHLWQALESIHRLAEQGRAELDAAATRVDTDQTIVDARECLEEARRLLGQANALQHHRVRVEEIEAAIAQRERGVYEHGLSLLQKAASALADESGDFKSAQVLLDEAVETLALVGGADRARALAGSGTPYSMPMFVVQGRSVREDKLTAQMLSEGMSEEERTAWTAIRAAQEQPPEGTAAGEPEPPLPDTPIGTTPTVGMAAQEVLRRGGRPARLDPASDGRLLVPRFASMEDVATWRVALLREAIGACGRYQEATKILVVEAERNIECFNFVVAQRQVSMGREFLRRAYCDPSHLDETLSRISKQVTVALHQSRLLLQETTRLLGDLDAVPEPGSRAASPRTHRARPDPSVQQPASQPPGTTLKPGPDLMVSGDAGIVEVIEDMGADVAAEDSLMAKDEDSDEDVADPSYDFSFEQASERAASPPGGAGVATELADGESLLDHTQDNPSAEEIDKSTQPMPQASDSELLLASAPQVDKPPPARAETIAWPRRWEPEEGGDGKEEEELLVLVGQGAVWEAKETLQRAQFLLSAVGAHAGAADQVADVASQFAAAAELQARVNRILASMYRRDRSVLVRLEYPDRRMELVRGAAVAANEPILNGRSPADPAWAGGPGGPLHFTIEPTLFSGLTLDPSTGVISGQPAVSGGGRFVVTCANAFGVVRTALGVVVRPAGEESYATADSAASNLPLSARVQRLIDLGRFDEAEEERRRELRRRLARFRGPYPKAYDMHRPSGGGGAWPGRRRSREDALKESNGDYKGYVSEEESVDRTRLQRMFNQYQLY